MRSLAIGKKLTISDCITSLIDLTLFDKALRGKKRGGHTSWN